MATGKITKDAVDALPVPPRGKRHHLWDETLKGFGVMVTDRGVRSYIVQYRIGGRGAQTRRVTIGKHGSPWTPARARDRARDLLESVRCKVDPFEAEKRRIVAERDQRSKADKRSRELSRLGFETIAERYLDDNETKKLRTREHIKAVIDNDLVPVLANRPLPDITAAELSDLIEKLRERGDSAARRGFSAVSAVLAYANRKERALFPPSVSPIRDVARPAPPDQRRRTLHDYEVRALWNAVAGLGYPFSPLYQLLILTGQRLREVAEARWSEFDLDKRQWVIPGSRTKNGHPTLVPLSEQTTAVLKSLPLFKTDTGILFTTNSSTPVSGFSRVKGRIDCLMKNALKEADEGDLVPWRTHDIRRTVATGLQALRVPVEVVEELLNHKSGTRAGVAGTYQLYRYEKEKRTALSKWASRVLDIAAQDTKSNVVPLRGVLK